MLQSFDIQGFRTFKHLRIDRLAPVNLVVGKNNVGKTMLLEALRLYVDGASFASLARLLMTRNEVAALAGTGRRASEAELRLEALFHGRPTQLRTDDAICLSDPTTPASALRIEGGVSRKGKKPRKGQSRLLTVRRGNRYRLLEMSEFLEWGLNSRHPEWPLAEPAFVHAGSMTAAHLGWLWDRVALTAGAANVVNALRIIAPVEAIALIADPATYPGGERMVITRIANEPEPVPLAGLGDGMVRIFELALATELAASRATPSSSTLITNDAKDADGGIFIGLDEPMLLIDEVEIGVHYSALPDVWRYLFRAARERGIQVFATTHSWDCIEAFQQAAAEEPEGSALLLRLEQKGEEHRAVLFDQDELPTVTKHHIEVR